MIKDKLLQAKRSAADLRALQGERGEHISETLSGYALTSKRVHKSHVIPCQFVLDSVGNRVPRLDCSVLGIVGFMLNFHRADLMKSKCFTGVPYCR
jgi:hypothetical protein